MHSPARLLLSFDPLQDADPPSPATPIDSNVVVVISLLLCAIICVISLALAARCAWLCRSLSANTSSAVLPLRKGIKKKALRALPMLSFISSAAAAAAAAPCGVELVDCAICLAEFADGDDVRILPQCKHRFHAACVNKWLGAHASCPSMCRAT